MPRIFGLADCNNFFASCERVFHPELRHKPVCVLSNNDGVIIARSNEVKKLGIPMGAPYFKHQHTLKRHNVFVFSSNFSLYGDLSCRVMSILMRHSPDIEIYSIDEAFMDFSNVSYALDSYGRFLRHTILQWTGIPVSIGFASTKTLAKAANELAKKSEEFAGVCDFTSKQHIDPLLRRLPICDIWGVGRRLAPVLRSYGLETALDLKNASDVWIRKRFSVALYRTVLELRGIECFPFGHVPSVQHNMVSSRSFGTPVTSLSVIREAISQYISTATARLRRQHCAASYIYVYIGTSFHADTDKRYINGAGTTLSSPTAYAPEFIRYATPLLERIFKPGVLYKKAGVMLNGIVPDTKLQRNLFSHSHYTAQQHRLMGAVDEVNTNFGGDTIFFASSGTKRAWSGKRELRSLRFSTHWNELLHVST